MNCQEAEKEILSLADFSTRPALLQAHLAQCESCSKILAEASNVDALFQDCRQFDPSPFLWTRIESGLRSNRTSGRMGWFSLPVGGWLTVAALLLFSVFLSSFRPDFPADPSMPLLAEMSAAEQSSTVENPFLIALADVSTTTNPFLEAMAPRGANPFRFQAVR